MIGNVTRNANFNSIAQYIFGKPGAETLLENVPEGRTVAEKAASMQWVAARNERVKRPAYHLSLSPAEGDDLSRGEWSMFCSQVLSKLGFHNCQVLVGLHHDVKYPNSQKTRTHAHLLINLVDDAGKCANTSWDYLKIPKVLRHLERSYGLQAVPDVGESGFQQDTSGQYRAEERFDVGSGTRSGTDVLSATEQALPTSPTRSIRRKLQDIIDEAIWHSSSLAELSAAMESLGVEVNNTEKGWWMRYSGMAFAGYQLGRNYTKPSIFKRLEIQQMADKKEPSNISNEATDDTPVSSMRDVFLSDTSTSDTDLGLTESEPEVTSDTSEPTEQLKGKHPETSEVTSDNSEPTEQLKAKHPKTSDSEVTNDESAEQIKAKHQKNSKPKPKLKPKDIKWEDSSTTQTANSLEETSQKPEVPESQNVGDIVVAPGNLIEMMKQQANHLEQSDYIDGRFYAGMFLDVTAHLAEVVEVGREVWSEGQGQETETQLEENSQPPIEIPQIEGDDDWLQDEEALHDFDERLSDSTEPPSSDVPIDVQDSPQEAALHDFDERLSDSTEVPNSDVPIDVQDSPQKEALHDFDERLSDSMEPPSSDVPIDVQESSIAVAESLSQFVRIRAAVHDLNLDEPIETNLGILQFSPDENAISITQNVTVARWDENLQEWQLDNELADSHKDNVARLLNNQAIDVEGYHFSGDEEERTITFDVVRFRAELTNDGWQIWDNSLSSEEQSRILQLPQTESEYTRSINGKDLIDYFQRHATEQFRGDVGSIHWKADNDSFDRIFEVSKQSDKSHIVEGFDLTQTDEWGNPRQIFSASIEAEGSIQCSQCEIPTADIDNLLEQSSQHRENKPERER